MANKKAIYTSESPNSPEYDKEEEDKLKTTTPIKPYSLIQSEFMNNLFNPKFSNLNTKQNAGLNIVQQQAMEKHPMSLGYNPYENANDMSVYPDRGVSKKDDQNTNDKFLSDLEKSKNAQQLVNIGYIGANIANMIDAAHTRGEKGFKSPSVSQYTPIPSTRDRDLAKGESDIAAQVASIKRFMEENGIIKNSTGILAESLKAKNDLNIGVGEREFQTQVQNNKLYDDSFRAQAMADSDTYKKNILKQREDNALKSHAIQTAMGNIFNTLTESNENNVEQAKWEQMMNSETDPKELARLKSEYELRRVNPYYYKKQQTY